MQSVLPSENVSLLWVHLIDDGIERHGVLDRPNNQLKVWIADLCQEHVEPGSLLEPPTIFVSPRSMNKEPGQF